MNKIFCGAFFTGTLLLGSSVTYAEGTFSMTRIPLSASAVNNNGIVAGNTLNNSAAALWDYSNGTITVLQEPEKFSSIYVFDINDSNQVIGQVFSDHDRNIDAVVWENGRTRILNDLKGDGYSRPDDINNLGQVVGISGVPRVLIQWNSATPNFVSNSTDILDESFINDSGQIAGTKIISTSDHLNGFQGFIRTDGVEKSFGEEQSIVYGMNNNGWVTGISAGAFLWDGDVMHKLGRLSIDGKGLTIPTSINDSGFVVGTQHPRFDNIDHGILWNGWKAYDLTDFLSADLRNEGWVITGARDINNHNQILALAYNTHTGDGGNVLLTPDFTLVPIPEPTTYAMLLAGLGLLGFVGLRRKNNGT